MAGRGAGPDFVESLARGLDVLAAFDAAHPTRSLSDISSATGLARPTARRLLLTLEELGFVRSLDGVFRLTPMVLTLGMAYVSSLGLWDIARPHLEEMVRRRASRRRWPSSTEATSSTWPGCRCPSSSPCGSRSAPASRRRSRLRARCSSPASPTTRSEVSLAVPSRSGLAARLPDLAALQAELADVRARGWALADEELAPGVRSIAVPVRDGQGQVLAAMNVTVHAAETSTERLVTDHLPVLLRAASEVSGEWALWQSRPHAEVGPSH